MDGALEPNELLEFVRKFLVSCGIHEAARSAIGEDLLQLVGRAACPERDEDDAGFARRPERINILNPVLGQDTEAVPWGQSAEVGPDPRALQRPSVQFGVGKLPARRNVDQRNRVGTETGTVSQNISSHHGNLS
jgi:hypothetical protein